MVLPGSLSDGLRMSLFRKTCLRELFSSLTWNDLFALKLLLGLSLFFGKSSVPLIQNLGCVQVPVFPRSMTLLSEQDTGLGWSPPYLLHWIPLVFTAMLVSFFTHDLIPVIYKVPLGCPDGSAGKKSACNAGYTGDMCSIPGWGRSPGEGHGKPLQYSCLENPKDWEAWWVTVLGVAKNLTRLND